jgi:hypothetical protein
LYHIELADAITNKKIGSKQFAVKSVYLDNQLYGLFQNQLAIGKGGILGLNLLLY